MNIEENKRVEEPAISIADLPNLRCELTTESVSEWFNSLGISCGVGMSQVIFKLDDEIYVLHTDALPMVSLVKMYDIEPEDAEVFDKVMNEIIRSDRLAKGRVKMDDDGKADALMFQVTWLEGSLEHFKEVLREYIGILDNAVEGSRYYYQKFSEEAKNKQTSQLYPTLEKN